MSHLYYSIVPSKDISDIHVPEFYVILKQKFYQESDKRLCLYLDKLH